MDNLLDKHKKAVVTVEVPYEKIKSAVLGTKEGLEAPLAPLSEEDISEIRALRGIWAGKKGIDSLLKELEDEWNRWSPPSTGFA